MGEKVWTTLKGAYICKDNFFAYDLYYVYNITKYTHGEIMRTNIVIDDNLMAEAQRVSGFKTKKETVEEALKLMVQVKKQSEIRKYRGKLYWEGDLDKMRTSS